jgi:signal transduction histidine kinase
LPKVARALEASLKQNRPYQMEFRGAGPNGSTIWVWTAATMLQTPNKPSRMIGIATDITARKRDEELLRSQARHLEELVRARTARLQEVIAELEGFSYTIAHDLRAPLRSMHGFASILREDHGPKLDEKGLEYIDRIAQSAGRMDELIQDVLSYSRVTRDELSLHPMDPAELLDQTIEAHAEMMKPFADLALLAQCFSNLLGNAVKFVAPGAAPVVRVEAEEHGEMVRICVRDNGIGIAPEHRERVFGLFQRLSQEYSGTGIGLAIVKRAAERMHGRAGVESTPGEGSCFWIELKRA